MRRMFIIGTVVAAMVAATTVPVVADSEVTPAKLIVGTPKADTLDGGASNDKIRGLAGKDSLAGHKGNDTIIAGRGADGVRGGDGNDTIYGGRGFDRLVGGNGNDTIIGGDGEDTLRGGRGRDFIDSSGDGDADFVDCGLGDSDVAKVDAIDTVTMCETVNVVS